MVDLSNLFLPPMPVILMCFISQIKDEVRGVLEFIKHVYTIFGFTFDLKLSTVCSLLLISALDIEPIDYQCFELEFNLLLIITP